MAENTRSCNNYTDIFSKNIAKIKNTVELLEKAYTKRESLIAAVATMRAQYCQDK